MHCMREDFQAEASKACKILFGKVQAGCMASCKAQESVGRFSCQAS